MKFPDLEKRKHIGKILLAYAGGAWVIIQVINLIITQYDWPVAFIDVFILLFLFGLPAVFLYAWYGNNLTKTLKIIYGVNVFLALAVISYYFIKPNSIHPNQIEFLKFKNNQKEIAQNIKSIAVLPFSNFTGDSEKEYLSYAIHDALINEIGSVSSLRIISKTSTLALAGQKKSIQEIATELKVDAIIEGSVLNVGDQIKVNVSLISAFPEEVQLWTKDYSVSLSDLLNVYSKITENLATEIELPLTNKEKLKLKKRKSVDPGAYEAYLKGKYNMGLLTKEGIMASQDYFNKAIELDSEFAPAYAALAGVWGFLKQMNFVTADQAAPYFAPNLEKAKKLDSTLSEIYYWEAIFYVWTNYDWENGESAFLKSIELNPNASETHGLYANFLLTQYRVDEAREEINIALDLDPNNPFILVLNGMNLILEKKYTAAIDLALKLQKIPPENPLVNLVLFMAYAQIEDYDNLIEQAAIWLSLENHQDVVPVLKDTYSEFGVKEAFQMACQTLENKDNSLLMAQTMFNFYIQAGNVDKTLDWIEKSYIRGDPDVPFINCMPVLDSIRDNPRLIEIIKRLKFQNPNIK